VQPVASNVIHHIRQTTATAIAERQMSQWLGLRVVTYLIEVRVVRGGQLSASVCLATNTGVPQSIAGRNDNVIVIRQLYASCPTYPANWN